MKRLYVLVIIVVVLAAVIAVAALSKRSSTPNALSVPIKTAAYGIFQVKLPENGVVQRPRVATIPTLVSGNLGQILASQGEFVSAGQMLATVTNPTLESNASSSQADYDSAVANIDTARVQEQNAKVTYQAQVDTAKSNLDEAARVYHADVDLYNNKAIPRNQLDADKAKLDQAQVQYFQAVQQLRLGAVTGFGQNSVQSNEAVAKKMGIINSANQQQLGFTHITAPFAGVIQSVAAQPSDPLTPLHPGDPLTQGQALFTIAESGNYIVKAQVDEQDIINVNRGQRANVSGQDFPGVTITGRVEDIAPIAIKSTDASSTAKQVLTTIRLDRSPSFLRDGMTVDIDILTTDMRNVLLVPNGAIVKEKNAKYIWVVEGGIAQKRSIHTGKSNDTQTIVTSGLAAGARYVTQPLGLTPGAHVRPAPSASPLAGS